MFKDYYGNELKVNDIVYLINTGRYGAPIELGSVVSFEKERVKVKRFNSHKGASLKCPENMIKVVPLESVKQHLVMEKLRKEV